MDYHVRHYWHWRPISDCIIIIGSGRANQLAGSNDWPLLPHIGSLIGLDGHTDCG